MAPALLIMEKTMLNNRVRIRNAGKQDAADIARLVIMAWPVDAFLSEDGARTVDDLTALIEDIALREDTLYSYCNTMIAEIRGGEHPDAAGIIIGYDGADFPVLRRTVQEMFSERFGKMDMKWPDETQSGEFYFDSVAVDPAYRGYGLGSALFNAMTERAVSLGYRTAGLLVDYDNPSAERLYVRLGFREAGDKSFFGHRMKHMQKDLSGDMQQ